MSKCKHDRFIERLCVYLSNPRIRNTPIKVCETPYALIAIGAMPLPMVINPNDVDKCLAERTANKNKNSHSLTVEELGAIPELLTTPAMIFKATNRPGYITVVTDRFDSNGNPFVIGVELNSKSGNLATNRVTSMYGRENVMESFTARNGEIVQGFIRRMILEGNLLAYDIEKAPTLFQLQEILSVREENVVTFDSKITYSRGSVNTKILK